MEGEWNNIARFGAINQGLYRLAHDQQPIGMGFGLRHNPQNCIRCRAEIAAMELRRIVEILESGESPYAEPDTGLKIEIVPIEEEVA